jgi:hypothetical protein
VRPHQFAEPMSGIRAYRDNGTGQCVRHKRSTPNEPRGFGAITCLQRRTAVARGLAGAQQRRLAVAL